MENEKTLKDKVKDVITMASDYAGIATTVLEQAVDGNEVKLTVNVPIEIETPVALFINRELSWLDFNDRVIAQYNRTDVPFHDRLTFLGIAASNLDEFISVRFSGLFHDMERSESDELNATYRKVLSRITEQREKINTYVNKGIPERMSNSIVRYGDERFKLTDKLKRYFKHEIFPILTPISLGSNKEVPKFNDNDVNFFIKLASNQEGVKSTYCFLQIPHQIPRTIRMGKHYYFVEDIVRSMFDEIFNNSIIESYILFKVIKECDTEVDHDDNISIIDRVNNVLVKREENNVIFLDVEMDHEDLSTSSSLLKKLTKLLKVERKHVYSINTKTVGLRTIAHQYLKVKPFRKVDIEGDVEWKSFKPKLPSELIDETSIFDYLDDDDLILHHPYHSYDTVVGFIQEAANDPDVISIKQTLYRVSSEKSPIIQALCNAAMSGKKVTVMLELLARFDERQNINLINKLNQSGCNIVYSLEGLKTHCKMCIVTKATKKGIVTYSHVGTGNYNEKTANIYTDISYLTSNRAIGHDLSSLFNMITGFSKPDELKRIKYSPYTLRPTLVDEMTRCCEESSIEDPSHIYIKINSLSDVSMVATMEKLIERYPTCQWHITVRGICSLPALDRYTNVTIKSVVGRFLEHSRIYGFVSKGKDRVYISSADMLTRNLDKRIEILCPINDKSCKARLFDILKTFENDTTNSWYATENGFIQRELTDVNCHNEFIKLTR